MEQGPILQQHLPIEHYGLPSEHEYNDAYSGHAHSAYSTGGAVEHLRRDATAAIQAPAPFAFHSTNGASAARFDPARGVASDTSSYQTSSNNFADSSSGSISSPSSAASSSLAYTNYPHTHCTSIPSFAGPVQPPQAFAQVPSYASTRELPNLDSIGTGMPPPSNPIRSSFSSTATDREAYANSTPFLIRSQLSPGSTPGYASFADTPRTALGLNGLSLSNNPYGHGHMASSPTYGGQQNECGNFPWPTLEIHAEMTCEGQSVTPEVHAKVEKGFFLSTVDQKWTCYRRNYFSVQCSFELHPSINNGRMHLKRTNSAHTEAIQAMGMRLSAAVDGSGGKCIELVQHTPKRDNGPKNKIDVTKVLPSPSTNRGEHTVSPHGIYQVPMSTFHATGHPPGPYLPLQNSGDGSSASSAAAVQASSMPTSYAYSSSAASHLPLPGQNTNHTFERVQFKQATANNGKRRASQQYFHLIVELFADVRKDGSNEASWVKVAHRSSEKIVVRGRSPSHYQNEGQHQNGRSGSTSGGSGYGAAGGSTFGNLTTGGFRQSSTSFGGGLSGGNYRTNAYGYQASPDHSGSSASSVDGGADNEYQADSVMSDAERNDIQTHEGYRYYPGPLYEGVQPGLPLPKIESGARFSTEPSQWAVKYESSDAVAGAHWPQPVGGVSRFQGVESSRGYYSDQLAATYSG
ncbi:Putative p53-like transcription factor, DNA-binding, NDT80 DNA-binding domain-containing protein [Septoria linicola]|uniref:P53-like transcription factor, DNA-binding, NDT80 DNA-binding domain-containing protein n=1 Tax=Septoria linicola TaxID=215465 RepID=A0A9Q9ELD8_9PEZI|nr:putative p53-like transcription factor, DNA-binding, NDT80 DNA-binding domain-containing protein [Septoria linicola]USW54272.1 Putative p53-like transcription factor, DNA-binding, NDT80 DNA-binding domain-containing protein [Septoria linicola]